MFRLNLGSINFQYLLQGWIQLIENDLCLKLDLGWIKWHTLDFFPSIRGLERMRFDFFQFWNISWDAKFGDAKPVLNTATDEKNKNHVVYMLKRSFPLSSDREPMGAVTPIAIWWSRGTLHNSFIASICCWAENPDFSPFAPCRMLVQISHLRLRQAKDVKSLQSFPSLSRN